MESSFITQPGRPVRGAVIALACVLLSASCQTDSGPIIRTITARALADKYSISIDAARHEFEGNDLIVEGYVLDAVAMPKNDSDEGMVRLGSEKSVAKGVQCWFTKYESAEFIELAPGDLIKVKGIFSGESAPVLKFCKLIAKPSEEGK